MKKFTFLLFTLMMVSLNYSCTEPEEEAEDLTIDIVGSYIGTSTFDESGAFFSEDDRPTTISKLSDSTFTFNMTSISPGGVVFTGNMSSKTSFTVKEVAVYDNGSFDGEGTLTGDSLSLFLSDPSLNATFSFLGSK